MDAGREVTKEAEGGGPKLQEAENPIFASRLTYYPDANLHGFALKIDNTPGALLRVIEVISKENLNIVSVEGLSGPRSDQSTMYVVIDFTGMTKGASELEAVIRNVPSVRSVTHVEPIVMGLLVDTSHFPIYLGSGERRCFIVSELFWQSFLNSGYDRMGVEASKLFFYEAGFTFGRSSARALKEILHLEREEIIRVLLHQGKAFGWWDGKGEANLLKRQLDLKLWRNWEGEYAKKWGVGCHAVRGFWEGVVTEILGQRIQVMELSCISKNREYCEFRLIG